MTKNKLKRDVSRWLGIIAIAAVIGFSMTACDDGPSSPPPPAPTGLIANAYSSSSIAINWNASAGATMYKIYAGNSPSSLQSTGEVTSTGANQYSLLPNTTVYFRVSAVNSHGESEQSNLASATTLSAGNFSLYGIWESPSGWLVEVASLTTGTLRSYGNNVSALTQSAISQGYITIGNTVWQSLARTSNDRQWTGQNRHISYNLSSPDVATGTSWSSVTITMNVNGQSIVMSGSDSQGAYNITYYRRN